MANIPQDQLTQWLDGDTFRAADYRRERDLIVAAVNDNYTQIGTKIDQAALDAAISASENRDHKGTWQGYTPQNIMAGVTITPASIGAASLSDLDATNTLVNGLKQKRYNLTDYPRLSGETDDSGRFNRAIADMPSGALLIVPDGYYYAENITITKPIRIRFEGEATIESVNVNPPHILSFQGSAGTNNYILTTSANRGDRSVKVTTSPTDISVGDMVCLTDDTTRVTDGQPDVNTEVHEVTSITQTDPEQVTSPAMNTDSNTDGVVDGFTQNKSASVTATYTLDTTEQAQKINVTASTGSGYALVEQGSLSVTAGQPYNLEVDAKIANAVGTFRGQIYVGWYNGSGGLISTTTAVTFTNTDWQRIKSWNMVAPTGAVTAKIELGALINVTGDTGTVWLKNASFKKSTTEIVFKDTVRLPKSVSASKNVYKINPLENVVVENFRYKIKEGSTNGFGIKASYVRNFRVTGLIADRGAESAVQVIKGLNVIVEKFNVRNPQVVGSGQGYGIQMYGGVNRVTIRDGVGYKMRHTVDLDSTFDALVDNVITYEDQQASFLICHNGWGSDITVKNCKALRAKSSGFVMESQGVSDPYTLAHYNVNIIDCEWQRDKDPADSVGYGAGVWLKAPVYNCIVQNFKAQYGDGSSYTSGQDNWAIRCLPTRNRLVISGLFASGLRRAVMAYHTSSVAENSPVNRIILRDSIIRNCDSVLLMSNGSGRRLIILGVYCENISSYFIEGTSGTYLGFVIDGLSLVNSNTAVMFQSLPTPDSGQKLRGYIKGIVSDRTHSVDSPASGWSLTTEDILLKGNGESVLITGNPANSGTSALPNGIVEGQRLSILNVSGNTFTIQSSNILYKGGATSISLSPTNRVTLLEWRNGTAWFQIV